MKKVTWGAPKISSANKPKGQYGSFKEAVQKSNERLREQEEAAAYIAKAKPAMVAMLEYKMTHGEPLIVMRPLSYMTSDIVKGDEIDDAFYNTKKSQENKVPTFSDVRKTIYPGTQLMLKFLDMGLNEFVFEDALKNEHSISFNDRDLLLMQTNVFEEVKSFFEAKGE